MIRQLRYMWHTYSYMPQMHAEQTFWAIVSDHCWQRFGSRASNQTTKPFIPKLLQKHSSSNHTVLEIFRPFKISTYDQIFTFLFFYFLFFSIFQNLKFSLKISKLGLLKCGFPIGSVQTVVDCYFNVKVTIGDVSIEQNFFVQ